MRNNTNLTILNGSEMKKIRIIDKTKIFLSTTRHTFKCSKQLNQKNLYLRPSAKNALEITFKQQ